MLVDLAVASTKGTTQDTVCSQRQSQMEPLAQVINKAFRHSIIIIIIDNCLVHEGSVLFVDLFRCQAKRA